MAHGELRERCVFFSALHLSGELQVISALYIVRLALIQQRYQKKFRNSSTQYKVHRKT